MVAFYVGNNSLELLVAENDGCDEPVDVTATSIKMFVDFRTDVSITHHGFLATITSA